MISLCNLRLRKFKAFSLVCNRLFMHNGRQKGCDLMKFSESLLQFRKAQGLSQEALAEKIGVSRQAVSKWETDEAFPDLQKAVMLSDALGISLDDLCGKEALCSEIDAPAAPKKRAFPMVLALLCLCAGLLLGKVLFGRVPEAAESPDIPPMPDTVTVSGVSFGSWGTEDTVTYQFVPSLIGSAYAYRISFTDGTGETMGFDAVCKDGMCAGTVELPPYGQYNVAVTITNGSEERALSIAQELMVMNNGVSWLPCTP